MQFAFSTIAALVALAGSAVAQVEGFDSITVPTNQQVCTAGETLDITWEYSSEYNGTVTIALLQGATQGTLEIGETIAANVDNSLGSYAWAIGSDVPGYATYGIKISLDSNEDTFQYSFPFQIKASDGSSSGSTTSDSTSSTESTTETTATTISKPSDTATTYPASSTSSTVTSSTNSSTATTTASGSTATGSSGQTTLTTATASSTTSSATSSSTSAVVTAGAGKVVAAFGGVAAAALFAL